jgi:hypothetical protein
VVTGLLGWLTWSTPRQQGEARDAGALTCHRNILKFHEENDWRNAFDWRNAGKSLLGQSVFSSFHPFVSAIR